MDGHVQSENATRVQHLNANSYISVGLLVVLLAGFSFIIKGQNDSKNETRDMRNDLSMQAVTTKNELSGQITELRGRIINLEGNKSALTTTDFFKWAVHLQQANPQIKVPEPETSSK